MSKILIIYKSNTGFTKRYANWISERVSCEKISFEEMDSFDMKNHNIIIYGGGMHASRINGLNKFKKIMENYDDKKIIVFATGGSPSEENIISEIRKNNFTQEELKHIDFYYFQSGLSYEKMNFKDKAIMKTYGKILELKRKKSKIEEGAQNAILESYDYSKVEHIKQLTDYLDMLCEKTNYK